MDGILIVDKPQGMTSHDVVDVIRRRFALKKVGHGGTLDPMATGVLVVLIGKCTKLSGRFLSDDKAYEATLVLGARSDTGDAEGRITPSAQAPDVSAAQAEAVFRGFLGDIEQVPPMYSALKVNGKKLYELARKGIEIERPPRTVSIRALAITHFALPEISFAVSCSKGTYVRTLCADIGDRLGCGAYLVRLRRTRSGSFDIGKAVTMDEIMASGREGLERRCIAG